MVAMADGLTVLDHPLLRHKLTLLRDRNTSTAQFRQVAREVSLLMAYEVLRDLPVERADIETPLEPMQAERISGKKLCLVSILRAGNGILEGMLDLVPSARVGHIGLYRNPVTLKPVEYYLKLPSMIAERLVVLVDPMLATGNSAAAAADRLKMAGVRSMKFVCLVAAPSGIATFNRAHPDVPVYTAAMDRELDEHGYIRPGLGDAGDRFYGTR
jgi:uracil phosphoribosyltransferase